jgi:hypothetical protein
VLSGQGHGTSASGDLLQLGDAFGRRLTPHPRSIERLFAQVKRVPLQVEMSTLSNLAP